MSGFQNIYDDKTFFEGYYALREKDDNHNVLIEQPAMSQRLPDLTEKRVLDLGCGFGVNCLDFVHRGAAYVLGLDISENMLSVAQCQAKDPHIEYRRMSMTDISCLDETFDLVYSSLAFHYIEDFAKLMTDIYARLSPGGVLLFSQEHPLNTLTGYFNRDEKGNRISYTMHDYLVSGKRTERWFVDGVEKYHRPMGQIITEVARAGFVIEEVCEPTPEAWALQKRPSLSKEWIKPCFMILRARKEV